MNSVVARIRRLQHLRQVQPSMLETNSQRGAPPVYARSASTAMAGPRSEPPMPMFTTSRNGWPLLPVIAPLRTPSAKASMRARSLITVFSDLRAADRCARRLAQRHVQHGAVLGGVDALAAPHGVDALLAVRSHRRARQSLASAISSSRWREKSSSSPAASREKRSKRRGSRSNSSCTGTAARRAACVCSSAHTGVRGPGVS